MRLKNNKTPPIRRRRSALPSLGGVARGITLIEVMISMSIFVVLATFAIMGVREVVAEWTLGERRRIVYEKAAGALDLMADDIGQVLTQEAEGVSEVKMRLIGDYQPGGKQQRLMFVRAFEGGPERATTYAAGDRTSLPMVFAPPVDPNKPVVKPPQPDAATDPQDYTGLSVGNFNPLGGMALVGYFATNQTLYRTILAPVPRAISSLLTPQGSQVVATDVLFLGFDYWSQNTKDWSRPKGSKKDWPEQIWDSTRGIDTETLKGFFLHRGSESLDDPEDDVFPQMIRITLTVDSPMPRCVYTKLTHEIGEGDGRIDVEKTQGFEDGALEDSFILIDDEWIHYSKKNADHFLVDGRGARNTTPHSHGDNAIVRTGKTFRRVVYIPAWRENFEPDAAYFARKNSPKARRQQ